MKKTIIFFALSALLTVTFSENLTAEEKIVEGKDSLQARRERIDKLKKEGIVGENNKGYLEFVGKSRKGKKDIEAENALRKKAYGLLAEKKDIKTEKIGKIRANTYRKRAEKGEYIQLDNGKWIKK